MCRFIAYMGNSLVLDEVLFKPKNSLIKQSIHARDREEPLNGDGFGLGWYAQDIDFYPALFKSIQPAWNDLNLQYLSSKLRSNCFFAHVRSASQGNVAQSNCHPFHYKQYLFMHNGDIGEFSKIKRYLRRELSDEIYNWIQGQTDSEHFFALFLERFNKKNLHFNVTDVSNVMMETIQEVEKLTKAHGSTEDISINAAITNGKSMIAIRYISNIKDKPLSLYYAVGSHFEYHEGNCHIKPTKNEENGAVLIVSEPLDNYKADWKEIPANHMLLVLDDLSIALIPIKFS